MKRHWIAGALLLLALLFSACSLLPENQVSRTDANEPPTPTPIPTAIVPTSPRYTVKRGEVIDEVTFNGRVSPVVEEELFFRTDGRVRATFAKRDDIVETGAKIAEFEIDPLERQLAAAKLNLERAQELLATAERTLGYDQETTQINLELAQLELQRLQSAAMPDATAVSMQQQHVRLAELAVERLKNGIDPLLVNDVKRAQLEVEKLLAEIDESTITAPFTGQLLSMSASAGQAAEAYRPIASIANIDDLEISANLMSSQMEGLEEGMEVTVAPVRRPGVILTGVIRQLPYPYGSGGNPTVTNVENQDDSTRIVVNEQPAESGLELGELVRVDVTRERRDDVLWLPPQALRNFDGRRFAVIEENGIQRRIDVTIGIETAERVEIQDGLDEGQVVVGQ